MSMPLSLHITVVLVIFQSVLRCREGVESCGTTSAMDCLSFLNTEIVAYALLELRCMHTLDSPLSGLLLCPS